MQITLALTIDAGEHCIGDSCLDVELSEDVHENSQLWRAAMAAARLAFAAELERQGCKLVYVTHCT